MDAEAQRALEETAGLAAALPLGDDAGSAATPADDDATSFEDAVSDPEDDSAAGSSASKPGAVKGATSFAVADAATADDVNPRGGTVGTASERESARASAGGGSGGAAAGGETEHEEVEGATGDAFDGEETGEGGEDDAPGGRRRRRSRDEADELADASKDADLATACKEEGNRHFGDGKWDTAAACYTEALRYVPRDAIFDKQRAVYFCNRAACHLNMPGRLEDALYDCDRALELDAGACAGAAGP
jgi:tetratricopeptide (TPR) repeat protein